MSRIKHVIKQTDTPYLNFYEMKVEHRGGETGTYYMASRAKETERVKALSHNRQADGVAIYAVYGEKKDRLVLIRQYRYPIGDYVYEFPAGLVEPGEDPADAAVREIYEETGLHFVPRQVSSPYTQPFYTSVGMTDECCGTAFGYCSGTPTSCHEESSEDIEVVLADREECKRILKEEQVALLCAYMLMHFIHCKEEDPLAFLDELN